MRWGGHPHELRVLASLAARACARLIRLGAQKPPRYCCKRCEQKIPSIRLPIFYCEQQQQRNSGAQTTNTMGRTRSRGRKHPRQRNCSAACCLLPFTPLLGYWYWYYRCAATTTNNKDCGASPRTRTATVRALRAGPHLSRKPFAVATLLTTAPSAKTRLGARSVGKKEQGDMS